MKKTGLLKTTHMLLATAMAISVGAGCGRTSGTHVDARFSGEVGSDGGAGGSEQPDGGLVDASMSCPASCDDKNPCTIDSCNPTTSRCDHQALPDETPCQGRVCTVGSKCSGGRCLDGPFKKCVALDQCHTAGVCNPVTGECTNPAVQGNSCDDFNPCTISDQCNSSSVCVGTPLCPPPLICDADAGLCRGDRGQPVFPSALLGKTYVNLFAGFTTNGLISGPSDTLYLAASIVGPSDLGNGPVPTSPTLGKGGNLRDVLLAQIDPKTGAAIWAKTYFGQQNQIVNSFDLNGAGALGLVGTFQGDFEDDDGNPRFSALTPTDQFIFGASAKDGKWLWGRRINLQTAGSTAPGIFLRAIIGDRSDDAFSICGTANRRATDLQPGNENIVWKGGKDVVVARLDGSSGAAQWARQVGGVSDESCSALAMDDSSNAYMAGSYAWGSQIAFGGVDGGVGDKNVALAAVSAIKGVWGYVVKLDKDGQALWATSLGSGAQIVSVDLMVVADGGLLVAGRLQSGDTTSKPQLAGFALDAKNGETPFVARIDIAQGTVTWAKALGWDSKIVVTGIVPASKGRVLISGSYSYGGKLGSFSLPEPSASARSGAFVALLDTSDGTVRMAKGFGNPTMASTALGVAYRSAAPEDEAGTSFLLTAFLGKMDFGPPLGLIDTSGVLANPSGAAMTLVKLAP